MAYRLVRKGKGGTLKKVIGNPRSPSNQRNLIVWDTTKRGVKDWIKEWGTKTQKKKHLK